MPNKKAGLGDPLDIAMMRARAKGMNYTDAGGTVGVAANTVKYRLSAYDPPVVTPADARGWLEARGLSLNESDVEAGDGVETEYLGVGEIVDRLLAGDKHAPYANNPNYSQALFYATRAGRMKEHVAVAASKSPPKGLTFREIQVEFQMFYDLVAALLVRDYGTGVHDTLDTATDVFWKGFMERHTEAKAQLVEV